MTFFFVHCVVKTLTAQRFPDSMSSEYRKLFSAASRALWVRNGWDWRKTGLLSDPWERPISAVEVDWADMTMTMRAK